MPLTLEDALLAIERDNDRLRALSTPTIAAARAAALGPSGGPLHRVPYCLKDVWDVAGLPTTRGSTRVKEPARESGPVHRAFEEAGAILVGKSNLSDLGLTPESESFVGGVTVHPEDPTRTPGGSSGGAAAAVAAGMAAFDWGTDFGGSIRLPAALCGVVGMRLSHASWPPPGSERDGRPRVIVRLNGMGPIARDLATCRAVLDAAAPRLRRSAPRLPPFRGLLVLAPDRFSRGAWAGFATTMRAWCARAGVPAWDAPLPPPRRFDDAFVRLIAAHSGELAPLPIPRGAALSALTVGRVLGDRRLHPRSAEVVVKLAILRRRHRRDARAAEREASALRAKVDALFADGFVLVTPTTTHPAPRRGTALSIRGLAAFVKLGNLVDATALSVPFGRFAEGLPRAISLVGPAGSEHRLLELAARLGLDGSRP